MKKKKEPKLFHLNRGYFSLIRYTIADKHIAEVANTNPSTELHDAN